MDQHTVEVQCDTCDTYQAVAGDSAGHVRCAGCGDRLRLHGQRMPGDDGEFTSTYDISGATQRIRRVVRSG